MKPQALQTRLPKHRIYGDLREAILSMEYRPGQHLVETSVAEQYGVSRTPVREALGLLVKEGLVEAIPRKGYLVTALSLEEALESYHVRLLLEPETAARAADRISEKDLEALTEIDARYFDGNKSIEVMNLRWHTLIAEASGNRRLARLVRSLLDEMRRVVLLDPFMHSPPDAGEHQAVTAAIVAHDPERAAAAMRAHIQSGRSRILARFHVG
ncbi:MAG: GntR family transcriptional regulator [Bacillota bacterium]